MAIPRRPSRPARCPSDHDDACTAHYRPARPGDRRPSGVRTSGPTTWRESSSGPRAGPMSRHGVDRRAAAEASGVTTSDLHNERWSSRCRDGGRRGMQQRRQRRPGGRDGRIDHDDGRADDPDVARVQRDHHRHRGSGLCGHHHGTRCDPHQHDRAAKRRRPQDRDRDGTRCRRPGVAARACRRDRRRVLLQPRSDRSRHRARCARRRPSPPSSLERQPGGPIPTAAAAMFAARLIVADFSRAAESAVCPGHSAPS